MTQKQDNNKQTTFTEFLLRKCILLLQYVMLQHQWDKIVLKKKGRALTGSFVVCAKMADELHAHLMASLANAPVAAERGRVTTDSQALFS